MVVQCSQMFANIKHRITVFSEHLFDVCEDSSKCEKRLYLAGGLPGPDVVLGAPCGPWAVPGPHCVFQSILPSLGPLVFPSSLITYVLRDLTLEILRNVFM